jgi:type II pantothenate kinase
MRAAIDFGSTLTDVLWSEKGQRQHITLPSSTNLIEDCQKALAQAGVGTSPLALAVTGGHSQRLPQSIDQMVLYPIDEVEAIARGGQALAVERGMDPTTPLLVVSAGTGTAMVRIAGHHYGHVAGTAVGGGTLLGLGNLLLNSRDALHIDTLALAGDANQVDLNLADVISGPLGALPADATAVNFGRCARGGESNTAQDGAQDHLQGYAQKDLAAGLVNLIGQTIALQAIHVAAAQGCQQIIVVGHTVELASLKQVVEHVLVGLSPIPALIADHPGMGSALGAYIAAFVDTSDITIP